MTSKRTSRGFTLIELLIAVAIVGIVSAIAYPSYMEYVTRTRRGTAAACLSEIAQHMERRLTTSMSYTGTIPTPSCMTETAASYGYAFDATNTSASTYALEAAPTGAQASDTGCGTLTLNHQGVKGRSGTTNTVAQCWR